MQEITTVVLDAMGGDHAPGEMVKGAIDAVNMRDDIKVILVGQEDVIKEEIGKYQYPEDKIGIVHAEEVIETAEPPVNAIRKKKNSSIVVGMNMVKNKEADAFVSAGSSGAVLVGGQVIVGRIRGIAAAACADHPDRERRFTPHRLRSQCGCASFPSGAVREDGFDLHGTCSWDQESESGDRKYRGRGR